MTRRRLTTILLVSLFFINSLGLTLWVHLRAHDHDPQSHQGKYCAICQTFATTRHAKAVLHAPSVATGDTLVAIFATAATVIPSHPILGTLHRRGPPLCA